MRVYRKQKWGGWEFSTPQFHWQKDAFLIKQVFFKSLPSFKMQLHFCLKAEIHDFYSTKMDLIGFGFVFGFFFC